MDWTLMAGLIVGGGVYLYLRFSAVWPIVLSFVKSLWSKPEEVKVVFFRPDNQKPKQSGVLIDGVPYRDITDERQLGKPED